MRRTIGLLVILVLGFLVAPLAAEAQPPTHVHRIGYLLGTTRERAPLMEAFLDIPRQNFLYFCGEFTRCGCIPFPSTAGPQRPASVYSGAHRRVSDQPTRGLTPLLHGLLMPPCFSTVQL
jgi:hypothetical protein